VVERFGQPVYVYVLEVTSRTGEVRSWTQNYPPRDCDAYPYVASSEESFFVGVQLTVLGDSDPDRDVFALEWGEVHAPPRVRAGQTFAVATRVRNVSEATWPAGGVYPVALAYHWQTPDGEDVVFDGTRTALAGDVAPGAWARFRASIEAPAEPGRYVLVLDLVYEGVSWFAERTGGTVARVEIEVSEASPTPL